MKYLAAIAILVTLGLASARLALAPYYERYNAAECHASYARAHTLADTLRVDLHPYASPAGGRNPRCGEVRAPHADSLADIPALR